MQLIIYTKMDPQTIWPGYYAWGQLYQYRKSNIGFLSSFMSVFNFELSTSTHNACPFIGIMSKLPGIMWINHRLAPHQVITVDISTTIFQMTVVISFWDM